MFSICKCLECLISIHAPARGATRLEGNIFRLEAFQSTPPRGERLVFQHQVPVTFIFQSTPPRGERRYDALRILSPDRISIHAPARGATLSVPACAYPRGNFNPRPREGSDQDFMPCRNCIVYFNPRPREGSDGITGVVAANMQIFQSTPPRGERLGLQGTCNDIKSISIHAPARGATH